MTPRQAILRSATEIFVSRENLDWEQSVRVALNIWELAAPPEEGTNIGERKSSRDAHYALRRSGIAVGVEESDRPYEEIPEAVEMLASEAAAANEEAAALGLVVELQRDLVKEMDLGERSGDRER